VNILKKEKSLLQLPGFELRYFQPVAYDTAPFTFLF